MATQSVFRFCNIFGSLRHVLNQRVTLPNPNVYTFRSKSKTLAEKAGVPLPPKRPLTAYFKFMKLIRSDLVKENPNIDIKRLMKIISQEWEKADPKVKENLEKEYATEKQIYLVDKQNYDKSLTEVQKQALSEARKDRVYVRERRLYKKKCREFEKPSRAPTGFFLYMKSNLNTRGSEDYKKWIIQQSKQWASLSDNQKLPFNNEAKRLQQKYREDMLLWEEKMIRLGNTDIIKSESLIEPKKSRPTATRSARK